MSYDNFRNRISQTRKGSFCTMDVKILDPEMECLMKEIDKEQLRLKEALKEKLRLIRYDLAFLEKENEETRERLQSKGITLEGTVSMKEVNSVIKEECIDLAANEFGLNEEITQTPLTAFSQPVPCRELEVNSINLNEAEQNLTTSVTEQSCNNQSDLSQTTDDAHNDSLPENDVQKNTRRSIRSSARKTKKRGVRTFWSAPKRIRADQNIGVIKRDYI